MDPRTVCSEPRALEVLGCAYAIAPPSYRSGTVKTCGATMFCMCLTSSSFLLACSFLIGSPFSGAKVTARKVRRRTTESMRDEDSPSYITYSAVGSLYRRVWRNQRMSEANNILGDPEAVCGDDDCAILRLNALLRPSRLRRSAVKTGSSRRHILISSPSSRIHFEISVWVMV